VNKEDGREEKEEVVVPPASFFSFSDGFQMLRGRKNENRKGGKKGKKNRSGLFHGSTPPTFLA